MGDSSHSIPGAGTGVSFDLVTYGNYTIVLYADFACFTGGTRILTEFDQIRIEGLRIGDLV